jgi:hypothetical protein
MVWQMQLAKNVIDAGLSTNNLGPMLRFWQHDVGLRFDHVLPVRRGQKQYRHDALGSVINHHIEPLPAAAPSGYRELIIFFSRAFTSVWIAAALFACSSSALSNAACAFSTARCRFSRS